MMVDVSHTPSGTITAGKTAVMITVEDVDSVDESDNTQINHYIELTCDGQDTARSPIFTGPGDFLWPDWIPPAAGTWTATLRREDDDQSEDTDTITVS